MSNCCSEQVLRVSVRGKQKGGGVKGGNGINAMLDRACFAHSLSHFMLCPT